MKTSAILILTAMTTLAFGQAAASDATSLPIQNVDEMVTAKWKENGLTPSEPASDGEFLRRISLDITGQIPAADEVVEFLKDESPDKREKMINKLLDKPLYAENWATIWEGLLIGRDFKKRILNLYKKEQKRQDNMEQANMDKGEMEQSEGMERSTDDSLKAWIEDAFYKNMPYNKFAYELITAKGRTDENGAAFYMTSFAPIAENRANIAGSTARLFMGVRMQCAQCHNHPYEKWKQTDFWGLAAFFARVRLKPIKDKENDIKGPYAFEVMDVKQGEVSIPDTKKPIPPKFLDKDVSIGKSDDMRQIYARIITSPDTNPNFAKAIVNRMWAHFFGVGFVNPIDDFREKNKPSNEGLLEFLSNDFVRNNYDLKRLIRIITNTKAYQLSSKPSKNNKDDKEYFSRSLVRSMSPEELFYSLLQATHADKIMQVRQKGKDIELLKDRMLMGFVNLFDDDEMKESVDFEGTISQALLLLNGQISNGAVSPQAGGELTEILKTTKNPMFSDSDRILERIFLATLSRYPTDYEKKKFGQYIKENKKNGVQSYRDVFWVLLNTTEFFYNH